MTLVSEILLDIAAYVDNSVSLPAGSDLEMWTRLLDQSQKEWADWYPWQDLARSYTLTSSTSMASIGLPQRFSKLNSPLYDLSTTPPTAYSMIDRKEQYEKYPSEKYIVQYGNAVDGYYLKVNPILSANIPLSMEVQQSPSALATLNDTVTCPSSQFLVVRTISKILSARSDPRFTILKAESETLLEQLVEEEITRPRAMTNETPDRYRKVGFRIGS